MALELKNTCEKCRAALAPSGGAYICSYECTYCASCAKQMNFVCPNCQGELVRRPRRKEPSSSARPTHKLALAIWAYEVHLLGAAGAISALVTADVSAPARRECRPAFFTRVF